MQNTFPETEYLPYTPFRLRRTVLDFIALLLGLIALTMILGIISWQFWHANRIYSGINVSGIPIGGMTRATALNRLNQHLQPYPLPPIVFTHDAERWPLTGNATGATADDAVIQVEAELQAAVNQAYLIGRDGNLIRQVREQMIVALGGHNILPTLTFNQGQLRHLVSQVASKARRPTRSGSEISGVLVPPQSGLNVDVEASLDALVDALQTQISQPATISIPLSAAAVPAPEFEPNSAMGEAQNAQASNAIGIDEALIPPTIPALIVRDESARQRFAIDPAQLKTILFSTEPPRIDRDLLLPILNEWADLIDIQPRDARLKFNPNSGTVSITQTSQWGRRLDVAATAQMIEEAVSAGRPQAQLVLLPLPPSIDMNRVPSMGIRELVASGTTYFKGSSPARVRNIEVAVSKFEGVVIPPDQIFSFNQIVEDVSSANGFEDSLIIWGDRTAVGVGGGVCQVSTTVFRAAYFGGMPIVERYNHGYVVDWYGKPGLDATIYTPNVDFKFRNDTGAYLLIDPEINNEEGSLTFNFYGTKPNRQVVVGEPTTTEVKNPEAPTYREDDSIAPGKKEQVEWEKEGKTVMVERKIIENGQERVEKLQSKYQPWQAVYLVPTGSLIETEATPSTTPSTTAETTPSTITATSNITPTTAGQ